MKILIDFKFIWLIHSEGQVQKVFIIMDRQEEINLLECLIMAQHPKTKSITEVTMHLKFSWIKLNMRMCQLQCTLGNKISLQALQMQDGRETRFKIPKMEIKM